MALIAVLEALEPGGEKAVGSRRQLLCVANTHIHANPELSDVKLWQVGCLAACCSSRTAPGLARAALPALPDTASA